jgi:hypothetical protein
MLPALTPSRVFASNPNDLSFGTVTTWDEQEAYFKAMFDNTNTNMRSFALPHSSELDGF